MRTLKKESPGSKTKKVKKSKKNEDDSFFIVYPKKLPSTKAWKLTSEYVRLLANGKCYTCGRNVPFNKLSAGHFIEKMGNAAIYFDLRGLRGQCFYCNRRLHGNKALYAAKLIEETGGHADILALHALCRESKFWRKSELREIEIAREKDIKMFKELSTPKEG